MTRQVQKPKKVKPTPPRKWKKGESGNPNGRPKGMTLSTQIKKLTAEQFEEIIHAVCEGNEKHLKDIVASDKATVLQKAVANSLYRAYITGDWDTVEKITGRVIGTQPKKIDITSNGKTIVHDSRDLSKLSTDELRLYKELEEKTKKEEGNVSTSIH